MNSRKVIAILVILELLILLAAVLLDGFSLAALQTTTRFSGRLSLFVFSIIFLSQLQPEKANRLLSSNPYLVFAIVHGIHLIELLLYVSLSGVQLIPVRVAGGFLAYTLIFAMPYLFILRNKSKITEKAFTRSETFYQFYVWFIFFMSYLPRVMKTLPNVGGNYWEHVLLFGWVIAIFIIKVLGVIKFSPARNA